MSMNQFQDDSYSERGAPSEIDHDDDFYAGPDDGGQNLALNVHRDEDNVSLAPSGPLLDHSHLRPGAQAALLSHERTLELYRANAKKVLLVSFAVRTTSLMT
jgi:uncharacterized protein